MDSFLKRNFILLLYAGVGIVLLLWRKIGKMRRPINKDRLLNLLEKAEELAGQYSGGYSGQFLSAQEFHKALKASIDRYKNGDTSQLEILYFWFAPTCAWDDFIGKDGEEIGNKIFKSIEKLRIKKVEKP